MGGHRELWFASQWGQVRCPSAGPGVALALVSSPCVPPPEFILEVLRFTTRQGPAGENAWCRKRQAWLLRLQSPSWGSVHPVKGALASIVFLGSSARGCRVGPRAHEGAVQKESCLLLILLLFPLEGVSQHPRSFGLLLLFKGREGTARGGDLKPVSSRPCWSHSHRKLFSPEVRVLIQGVGLTAHQGGCVGGEMPSAPPPPPRGWHPPPGPPVPSSACCRRRHRCHP